MRWFSSIFFILALISFTAFAGLEQAIADETSLAAPAVSSLRSSVEMAFSSSQKPEQAPTPSVELELGKLSLENVDGESFNAERYNSKKVVLYFWSIYCRGCIGPVKELELLRDELAKKNVELLTIHLFEPDKATVAARLAKLGFSLPIMLAPKKVRDLFSVRVLPTSLIFDEKHKLVGRLEGEFEKEGLRVSLFKKVSPKESQPEQTALGK